MLTLENQNDHPRDTRTHLVIRSDEPMRLEIRGGNGLPLAVYGYTGTTDDLDQEPVLVYLGD